MRWLRNLAVAAGNALRQGDLPPADRASLEAALGTWQAHPEALVREHVAWALRQAR